MRYSRRAAPDQTTRAQSLRNRRSLLELAIAGLFVDGGAPAGGGGGAPAAPAAAAAPAPAAAPAAGAAAAPAAGEKGGAAAPAAGAKDELGSIVGKVDDKGGAPAAPTAEAARAWLKENVEDPDKKLEGKTDAEVVKLFEVGKQRQYLVDKAGAKAADVNKLSEADLKKQYDEAVKAEAAKAGAIDVSKIKVPAGVEFKPEALQDLAAVLTDEKLSPADRAQKLVDAHAKALTDAVSQTYQVWHDTQKKWQGEVKADKEIGGDKYDNTRAVISKAVSEIMGKDADAVFEAFKFTGAGNNPAIVRLMARIGNLMAEGTHVGGDAPGAAKTKSFGQRVAAMYPSASGSQPQASA